MCVLVYFLCEYIVFVCMYSCVKAYVCVCVSVCVCVCVCMCMCVHM